MKTREDLNELIPTIVDLISKNDHEFGESYDDLTEDGWQTASDSAANYFCYDEDGWTIDVDYQCDRYEGESVGHGEVTAINVYHQDLETGEETELFDKDLLDLWRAIDEVLMEI